MLTEPAIKRLLEPRRGRRRGPVPLLRRRRLRQRHLPGPRRRLDRPPTLGRPAGQPGLDGGAHAGALARRHQPPAMVACSRMLMRPRWPAGRRSTRPGRNLDAVVADLGQDAAVDLLEADRDLGSRWRGRGRWPTPPARSGRPPPAGRQLRRRLVGDLGGEAGQLAGPPGTGRWPRPARPRPAAAGAARIRAGAAGRRSRWRSRPAVPAARSTWVAEAAAEGLELEGDGDHGLDGVVVDVAGDLASLLLLAGHHPLQQLAALLVELAQAAQGPVMLGDVAQHHQPADRGSLPVGMATTVGSKRRGRPSGSPSARPACWGTWVGRGPPRPPRAAARPAGDRSPRPGGGRGAARPAGWRRPPGAAGRAPAPPRRWSRRPARGHRADAEQLNRNSSPDQHQAGHGEQERGQVDPPERPDVEVVEQVEAIGHHQADDQHGGHPPVDAGGAHKGCHHQDQAAPHDHAGVDQVGPEQRAGLGHGAPGRRPPPPDTSAPGRGWRRWPAGPVSPRGGWPAGPGSGRSPTMRPANSAANANQAGGSSTRPTYFTSPQRLDVAVGGSQLGGVGAGPEQQSHQHQGEAGRRRPIRPAAART